MLNYIEDVDKESNFFAEYGLFIHAILEKFFKNELEIFELVGWYEDNYSKYVVTPAPSFPAGMAEQYYDDGKEYFENFDFPKDDYEVLTVEDDFNITFLDNEIIIKPDLVLKHKKSKKNILCDYKTSVLFKLTTREKNCIYLSKNGLKESYIFKATDKKEKLVEYIIQMYLYCLGLRVKHKIQIDEIRLWFIRQDRELIFNFEQTKSDESIDWFQSEINKIKNERLWKPITALLEEKELKKATYFCNQICNFRSICQYKSIGE
jgi:hypothetical protein